MNEFLDRVAQGGPDLAGRATVLFVVACGLSLALNKGSAAQRHLVWAAALAGSLVLPVIHFSAPEWRVWPTVMAERNRATASPEDAILVGWAYSSTTEAVPANVPWEVEPVGTESQPTRSAASRTVASTVAKVARFARTIPVGPSLAALWLVGVVCGCAD